MPVDFHRDLERLRKEILTLGGCVEEAVDKALIALTDRRPDLAREVLDGDHAIDLREVHVEAATLRVLGLHQPVAQDLRFLVTVLKVNNDLERMGDLAVNVAERALYLCSNPPLDADLDFPALGEKVRWMLRECLEALVRLDVERARAVILADDEVDQHNRRTIETLEDRMQRDPTAVRRGVHTVSASRHLERIADLATNVAEDVIFLVDGEVVRHRHEDYVGQERAGRARGDTLRGTG